MVRPMRTGRVSVTYRPDMVEPLVQVVPDDGSEPIALRVSEIELHASMGDAARVEAVMFLHSLDIEDEHGSRVRAHPLGHPVVFPDIEVSGIYHEPGTVGLVAWGWRAPRRRRSTTRLSHPLTLSQVKLTTG